MCLRRYIKKKEVFFCFPFGFQKGKPKDKKKNALAQAGRVRRGGGPSWDVPPRGGECSYFVFAERAAGVQRFAERAAGSRANIKKGFLQQSTRK
jgi:hypothetical protein